MKIQLFWIASAFSIILMHTTLEFQKPIIFFNCERKHKVLVFSFLGSHPLRVCFRKKNKNKTCFVMFCEVFSFPLGVYFGTLNLIASHFILNNIEIILAQIDVARKTC